MDVPVKSSCGRIKKTIPPNRIRRERAFPELLYLRGFTLILIRQFPAPAIHEERSRKARDRGDDAEHRLTPVREGKRNDRNRRRDDKAYDAIERDAIVLLKQVVDKTSKQQHGRDYADCKGNQHIKIQRGNSGGHWLIQPQKHEKRRGTHTGYDQADAPECATEEIPAKRRRNRCGRAQFKRVEERKQRNCANSKRYPHALTLAVFCTFAQEAWERSGDQSNKQADDCSRIEGK
ncbi:hypothetical protein SDC9_134572 [bioreactor metagenome]|uniref:Uncharacterized protein n=1 Tax=bioreactor metagenome TaxID=1076179 RepID=A0A645DDN6_9ZZZZ